MLDLTGSWSGQFSYYPRRREPNFFSAELIHENEWLSGRIEEIASNGPLAGQLITATLQGRVTGLQVDFLKIYDRQDGVHDTVIYTGQANSDGTEISGRWRISVFSSSFLMMKPRANQVATARSRHEHV